MSLEASDLINHRHLISAYIMRPTHFSFLGLSLAALALAAGPVHSQSSSPARASGIYTEVIDGSRLLPGHYRLGNAVIFFVVSEKESERSVTGHLAACDFSWASNILYRPMLDQTQTDQQLVADSTARFEEELVTPIEIKATPAKLAPFGELIRSNISTLCKTGRPAPTTMQLTISQQADGVATVYAGRVTRTGGLIDAWIRRVRLEANPAFLQGSEPGKLPNPFLKSTKVVGKMVFDCKRRMAAVLTYQDYDKEGKPTDSGTIQRKDLNFQEPVPGSVGDTEIDFICKVFG